MKINMEFDQLDIPFDMQFGDWLPASPGDPNAVHFIPQALTEEEKAQARANIGAANLLIVTLSDSRLVASRSADQIYQHIQNGGIAMLDIKDKNDNAPTYIPLIGCEDGFAVFGRITFDGSLLYRIDNKASVEYTDYLYATYEAVQGLAQAVDGHTEAIRTLEDHATYKKLYDRVEITADDVAAAGEEGITVITIGNDDVDLSQYNDILFRVFVPADEALNSGNKNLTIYSTSDSTHATGDANILLKVQGTAISSGIIKPDKKNFFMIRANFADNNFLYGELIKHNDAGSSGYPGSANGWVNVSSGFTKSKKKYFHIGSNGSTFKFPAGTYVEVYGR